jgi:hypothetical protein
VCTLSEEYWTTSGESLKDYRDLDQHYFTLCKHVVLQWSPEERVLVFLPDNPDVTAESQLTFEREIDGLRYFIAAFDHLHRWAERIAIELGFKPKALPEELDTSGMGNLEEGVRQTLMLWFENSQTGAAIEMGQLEDRRLYFQKRIPGAPPPPDKPPPR